MFYGLQFNTSGGESMQVVINTALQVYARASSGGIFGEWKYVCGPGEGDGALEVEKATVAEKAYRLASPMTITFAGDAQGAVSFDGSGNGDRNAFGRTALWMFRISSMIPLMHSLETRTAF